MGNGPWLAATGNHLGQIAFAAGETARATTYFREALELNRNHGDLWGIAISLANLSLVAVARGDPDAATVVLKESLDVWRTLGSQEGAVISLAIVAHVFAARGEHRQATRLFAATWAANETLGHEFELPTRDVFARTIALLQRRLGPIQFAEAWSEGTTWSLAQAIAAAAAMPLVVPSTLNEHPADASAPVDGLSPRQREVLHLLVAGQTDRQIADGLFISRRTVQVHVAAIFAKHGVNTRTAAATTAIAAGLVTAEPPPPA